MSILIKGMKMPKDGTYWCEIGVAGDIAVITIHGEDRKSFHLVELPDHGDLIEREYAVGSACSGIVRTLPTTEDGEDWIRVEEVRQSLKSVPAVIPAERGKE